MEMPGIETQNCFVGCRIGEIETVGADRIGLGAYAKELAFHCHLVMFSLSRSEDLIERFQQAPAGGEPVGRHVFVAVGNPDIHHRGVAELLAERVADPAARDAMIDPELANPRIGMAQCEALGAVGVREAGRVEIKPDTELSRPCYPSVE